MNGIYSWDYDYLDGDDEIYDDGDDDYQEELEEDFQGPISEGLELDYHGDFEDIPAWRAAYSFSKQSYDFVSSLDITELRKEGTRLKSLLYNGSLIAAHVAGGHGIGYDDEVICGNIVKCKLALACTDECITVLRELSIACSGVKVLLSQAVSVRSFIHRRITELREKVWW